MKPPVPTRPKDLPKLRESQPVERKGEVLSENLTEVPKDLSDLRESQPEERKDEASSSSSTVGVVEIESTTSETMSEIIVQNQELTIATADNTFSSVGDILQRDLWIEPGEASIWSRLDELGHISARLMIQRPFFGNWVVITPEFGSQNIIIQYPDPTAIPCLQALLTLKPHNLLTDRSDEELQFEQIQLTWSTNRLTLNPFVPQMNIQQNTKSKKMVHHH